jgi:hypothetical protein
MRRESAGEGIDPLRPGDEQLGAGCTSAMRKAKIGFFLLTARSTSRATKAESFEALDRTRTKLRALSMPLMISSP